VTPSRVRPITPGRIPGHEKEPPPTAEDDRRTSRVNAGMGDARDVCARVDSDQPLLAASDAARILGVTPATVRLMQKRGELPTTIARARRRIQRSPSLRLPPAQQLRHFVLQELLNKSLHLRTAWPHYTGRDSARRERAERLGWNSDIGSDLRLCERWRHEECASVSNSPASSNVVVVRRPVRYAPHARSCRA
jgi:hypothetical protein